MRRETGDQLVGALDQTGEHAEIDPVDRDEDADAAIGFDEAGTTDGIALAWLIELAADHRPMILQKSGGLAGFMTYVAFAPSRQVGVFVAVNKIDFGMFAGLTEGANELIASLAPQ